MRYQRDMIYGMKMGRVHPFSLRSSAPKAHPALYGLELMVVKLLPVLVPALLVSPAKSLHTDAGAAHLNEPRLG